ncbi:MAG: hypothetical protein EOO41_04605 [Methanobacteriota archaeon]|nr:MAG: hypothetical protein EOO41_04605 [Euryarchaeota archaeon]
MYPSDVEPLLNVTAAASRMSTARSPRAAANLLHAVPTYLQQARALIEAWRVPPSHPVYQQKEQCLDLIRDAASMPQPLAVSDDRVAAAMAPMHFEYTIGAHLSAPEPVTAGF